MSKLELFDYDLPDHLIATRPPERRGESRLLCMDRRTGAVSHRRFGHITDALEDGDVLVVNDARVIPARLFARRSTGGRVEMLLVRPGGKQPGTWLALVRSGGALREGEPLTMEGTQGRLRLLEGHAGGYWTVTSEDGCTPIEGLLRAGELPLPHYIRRARRREGLPEYMPQLDAERYQTVFASRDGAVAAPTAGLHFTEELLERLREKGVLVRPLSLLVGPGTFRPVRSEMVEQHVLEAEPYHLPGPTAQAVHSALEEGRRVVATGTTCCRVLEHVARRESWRAHSGWTDLYIYPPFEFRVVGALITNFHLPRSSLLILVCAFAGREKVLRAYREAVREGYHFYSYGDAMFLF